MKKEKIRLIGMTIVTVVMFLAVYLTFPVKYVRMQEENTWVLVSRIYTHRADSDYVLLSNGKAVYLKDAGKEDKVNGRILLSGTEGFLQKESE